MKRAWIPVTIALVAIVTSISIITAPAVRARLAAAAGGKASCETDAHEATTAAGERSSCETGVQEPTAAAHSGAAKGTFDPTMSGVCRLSCSAQEPYEASEVVAQPGALPGRLTRCPVSGVVFRVDSGRPRVTVTAHEYVVCCDGCAKKLRKDPARFVRV